MARVVYSNVCRARSPIARCEYRVPLLSSLFFFQAEDGIRDHCVTGVQTCALPIFDRRDLPLPAVDGDIELLRAEIGDRTPRAIDDLHVNGNEIDRRAKRGLLRLRQIGRASCRERV